MHRSRLVFFSLATAILHIAVAAADWAIEVATFPLRSLWPEAFPTAEPSLRSLGVQLSVEDAKPLARRLAVYRQRVGERTHQDRRALQGLILAG